MNKPYPASRLRRRATPDEMEVRTALLIEVRPSATAGGARAMISSSLHEMARLLGGEVHRSRISCPGPGHSPKDRSLSVWFDAEGNIACNSFASDDWAECMDYVRDRLGLPEFGSGKHEDKAADRRSPQERLGVALTQWEKDEADRRADADFANRIWARGIDPGGTSVAAYLEHRRLDLDEGMAGRLVRFLEDCPRQHEKVPALLVRFSPIIHPTEVSWGDDPPVTCIQRIFLDTSKPKGHDGKWLMGHPFSLPEPFLDDGIIVTAPSEPVQVMKLSPDEDVSMGLHLAEGFETGLAAMIAGFRPLWSSYSADAIARFPVLPGIEAVTILADHDQAGLSAAFACAQSWQKADREAAIRFRSRSGSDYADR
jgi:putative DNA primase/helicase